MINNQIQIGTRASVMDTEGNLWLSNYFFNGLFKMSFNNHKMEFIDFFPNVELGKRETHIGARMINSEIYFMPYINSLIHIYDLKDNRFSVIEIPAQYGNEFTNNICINNNLYFISKGGRVLCCNTKERIVVEEEFLSREIDSFINKSGGQWHYSVNEEGFVLIDGSGNLMKINISDKSIAEFTLRNDYSNIEIAYYCGDEFWFSLKNSQDILLWNRESDNYEYYTSKSKVWGKEKYKLNAYNFTHQYGNEILFSNYNAAFPVRVDKNKKNLLPICDDLVNDAIFGISEWGPIFSDIYIYDDLAYFIPCYSRYLLIYNKKTGDCEKINFSISVSKMTNISQIIENIFNIGTLYETKELFDLSNMISYLND